mgnify:CR=1 FL=1
MLDKPGLAGISAGNVKPALSRFGNNRRDRPAGTRQNRVSRTVVRMPANADRMPVMVGQDRLHRVDIVRTCLLTDQASHPIEPRKRIRQTYRIVLGARVRSTKKMIRVSDETFAAVGNLSRTVGGQLDVENRTRSIAEHVIAARTNRVITHEVADRSEILLLQNLAFQRVMRKPRLLSRTTAE